MQPKELLFGLLVDPRGITVAAAAAQLVVGVTNVHDHREVRLSAGDYRDDATLTTAANNALRTRCGRTGQRRGFRTRRQPQVPPGDGRPAVPG
ncbi:MAG: hypothetical protein QOF95_2082, partial [Pseudonocardiales bacterium]|nr:hypothetical protein [Pseudonocardiales bacterium]